MAQHPPTHQPVLTQDYLQIIIIIIIIIIQQQQELKLIIADDCCRSKPFQIALL
jgi:hypothetical protein